MKIIIIFCSLLFATVQASDLAKERRWAEQTVDSIMDGEAAWLKADGLEFLSIYTEAEEASGKGMIVVHGTGIHPNWDQVVKPIRVEMTTQGWNTLSVQMPILHNEATYDDYVPLYPEVAPRLKAAEDYLLKQGKNQIVIVAHSQGATMSSYYLANNKHRIKAAVLIGMPATLKGSSIDSVQSLKKINIPVLDLYGSEDLETVLNSTEKRKSAAAHNKSYQQKVVTGAEHFFDGKNDQLIEVIDNWLDRI